MKEVDELDFQCAMERYVCLCEDLSKLLERTAKLSAFQKLGWSDV
jgi:hypothetical protein